MSLKKVGIKEVLKMSTISTQIEEVNYFIGYIYIKNDPNIINQQYIYVYIIILDLRMEK